MKLNTLVRILFLSMSVISCETNNSSGSSSNNDSDEFCEYEYITDSIGEEAVSHDCAIIYTQLQQLQWRWEDVKSPSMIAKARSTWKKDITDAARQIKAFEGEEAYLLDSVLTDIKEMYKEKCHDYLIPASGVISNLKTCIKRVDEVNTKRDLERFREPRIGMLNDLDKIHLCIEESSNDLGTVKRLAETLKSKYEEKCTRLGVQ